MPNNEKNLAKLGPAIDAGGNTVGVLKCYVASGAIACARSNQWLQYVDGPWMSYR